MTKAERERLLQVKAEVMRRAGLTVESVERNAALSRQKLLRSEKDTLRDAPRLQIAN